MKRIIPLILVLALASLACGFSFNIPSPPTPRPDVTEEITVAAPKSGETRLTLQFGAGELTVSPGAEETLVEGTAIYNVPAFKPEISSKNGEVVIKQGEFKTLNVTNIRNSWDLKLGATPMALTINAGAYEGRYELGGLALEALTIQDGAANVELSFSAPNETEMSVLRYETGASSVRLTGLANANCSTMFFNGGAGDYTLDFSGDLQREITARVETGFSSLQLVIPKDVNASVTVEGGAINVTHSSGWAKSGSEYTQTGEGPLLTIIIKSGAGNVTITD